MRALKPTHWESICIIMAKQPQAGSTKTRLCPPLSPTEAADLYEALLKDTLALAGSLEGIDLAVAITPPDSRPYFEGITPAGARLMPISGCHIGDCLVQSFENLFELGYKKAIALNSDGPSLPPAYLLQAAQALEQNDVVLGPGFDGGYYLIGLKHLHRAIFDGIAWSSRKVMNQTLQRAAALGLSVFQTPVWYDVDTAPDLRRLIAELNHRSPDHLVHTRRFLGGFDLSRLDEWPRTEAASR
jgi:rSAM/selenodomain-associated transferase 1